MVVPAEILFWSFGKLALLAKSSRSTVGLDDTCGFLSGLLVFILCDLCREADLYLGVVFDFSSLTSCFSCSSSASSSSSSSVWVESLFFKDFRKLEVLLRVWGDDGLASVPTGLLSIIATNQLTVPYNYYSAILRITFGYIGFWHFCFWCKLWYSSQTL